MTTELIQLYDTVSEKIGKEGATALANYITKFTNERLNENFDNLVSKTEFHQEVAEIRMDIADVRAEVKNVLLELKQDITELRTEIAEVRTEIANVRSELKQDIAEIRNDMTILRTNLQNELKDGFSKMNRIFIQWFIGFFTSLVILILTLYFNR